MAMSAEMEQMISVVNKYAGRVIGVWHNYYVEPDIPEKVAKKLMKNFDRNLPINSLIAFFDTSLLGTSSSGLLFTVDGFYHKFITKPIYIAYQDITDMHIDGEYLNVSYLDNCGLQGHVSSYSIIDSFIANLLLEMITALKGIDALQALEELVDISTPKIADNLIDRFVEVVTPFEDYGRKAKPTSEILPEPVGRAALLPRYLHPRTDAERHLPLAAQLGT